MSGFLFKGYPVRKEAHQNLFQMSFFKMEEADFKESLSEAMPAKPTKKVLPDRMRPARDKANEKLVEFIVKAKGADKHLQAILKREKQSQWLKEFLDPPPYLNYIETYLEDDEQQELVINYLREVYQEVGTKKLRLRNGDSIRLILDVLFPEVNGQSYLANFAYSCFRVTTLLPFSLSWEPKEAMRNVLHPPTLLAASRMM